MSILTFLFISFPIFYIWGIISFIRIIFGGGKKQNRESLPENPIDRKRFLESTIREYQTELNRLSDQNPPQMSAEDNISVSPRTVFSKETVRSQPSFQNWYKDNSINLLLYLGAFLIVVSVAIFIGIESVLGISKALMVSGLTIAFLVLGLWFYNLPKIRNAGSAFAGIGALLIPIAGLGWYKFVFEAMGVGIGVVWLITSFVGLFVYIILARYFKNAFYSYVTSFSSISFALAFVNTYGLESSFYVLASVLSGLLLLLVSIYFKKNKVENAEIFLTPFNTTANIVMPVSIFYGLFLSTSGHYLFTGQATLCVLLGTIFYLISYAYSQKSWHILLSAILFSLGVIYFGNWQHLTFLSILYLLSGSVGLDLAFVYLFQERNKLEERSILTIVGLSKMTLIVLSGLFSNIETIPLIFICSIAVLVGVLLSLIYSNILFICYSSVFMTFVAWNVFRFFDIRENYILGFVYLAIGFVWYFLAVKYKKQKNLLFSFGFSTILYFLLSAVLVFSSTEEVYQLILTLIFSAVCYSAYREFAKKEFVYFSNILIVISLKNLLHIAGMQTDYHPLAFASLGYIFYLIGSVNSLKSREYYRNSGLITSFATPIVSMYSFSFQNMFIPHGYFEKYALMSSYTATVLFSFDSVSRRLSAMGYTASAMAIATYLWQIHYLGVTNFQYYTLVLGLYFCTLAFLQKKSHNESAKQLFDILGTGFLILPTWFQSFGLGGLGYALLLGVIGVTLFAYGVTFADKWYKYSGILAIVLAVISQSKWAIVGVAGLVFLGIAMYLLLYRKNDNHNQ